MSSLKRYPFPKTHLQTKGVLAYSGCNKSRLRLAMTSQLLQKLDNRGVLTLSLNRPEVHNAFGDELIAELTAVLKLAEETPDIRLIIITGTGSSFSSGADLNWMRGMINASLKENQQDARRLAKLLRTLSFHAKPTIARINGSAFGGAVGLISCCDINVSLESAKFALTEVRLGLVPAVISPYVFRRIGEFRSRRYFQTAERMGAQRAKEIGLVDEIVTDEKQLDEVIEQQADLLLRAGPDAILQAKKLVLKLAQQDAEHQARMDMENAHLIAELRVSDEGQEGLSAFLEKRTPAWVRDTHD
jgi:methylglutaconyl-CoA hydratase